MTTSTNNSNAGTNIQMSPIAWGLLAVFAVLLVFVIAWWIAVFIKAGINEYNERQGKGKSTNSNSKNR